jgi:hypothetical protein
VPGLHLKSPRNIHLWLPGYLKSRIRRNLRERGSVSTVWLMIGDHYEPLQGGQDVEDARSRVAYWRSRWPAIAARHQDSTGRAPQYTFFYAQEEYRPELIEPLAEMTRMGLSDVEIHLHHDGEGEQDFVTRMATFRDALHARHGLLRTVEGRTGFAFIHGNWALDNSHPSGRYCGLNNEITLLRDLGCYADFTMPSAPSPAQTRTVNTIYWAIDDPQKPKSHDRGTPLSPGAKSRGDLLMIQGPLGVRLREPGQRAFRIEMGELAGYDLPSAYRARLWLRLAPRVGGIAFIKLHTHGADLRNMRPLLEGGLDTLFTAVKAECDAAGVQLRYGTAWDIFRELKQTNEQTDSN